MLGIPTKVVVFTNSETEANELAMLMARLYTGCHDIISLSYAYRGNAAETLGAAAHSNYKFNVVQSAYLLITCNVMSWSSTELGASVGETPAAVVKKCKYTIGMLFDPAAALSVLYKEALPAFDVMGKKSFFLGHVGNGAKMKLVVNMVMGSMINAFSEGLVLADESGLSSQTLLDVLDLGAIPNPMIQDNYSPAFLLKHQQKDMRLAIALAHAVSMPVAAAANDVTAFYSNFCLSRLSRKPGTWA